MNKAAAQVGGGVVSLMKELVEPIEGLDTTDVTRFAARVGDAKVVVLGGAALGASEPFRWRARLTRELLDHHGFTFLAADADWADAAHVDRQLRVLPRETKPWRSFDRFPRWAWRSYELVDFLEWLRAHDAETRSPLHRAGLFGLDVLGSDAARTELVRALDGVDPTLAARARQQLGVAGLGTLTLDEREGVALREIEAPFLRRLHELLAQRLEAGRHEGERYLDALDGDAVKAAAEPYWRALLYSPQEAWNLHAQHLAATLETLLAAGGSKARAVVWADDAQAGDSTATEAGAGGAKSLGHLLRQRFGARSYLVGFGLGHGAVLAAKTFDGELERVRVKPLPAPSLEATLHEVGTGAFMLPLRAASPALREALAAPLVQRWWGAVQPEALVSARLAEQFDEYAWFGEGRAVSPLSIQDEGTWPFASEAAAPPPSPLRARAGRGRP